MLVHACMCDTCMAGHIYNWSKHIIGKAFNLPCNLLARVKRRPINTVANNFNDRIKELWSYGWRCIKATNNRAHRELPDRKVEAFCHRYKLCVQGKVCRQSEWSMFVRRKYSLRFKIVICRFRLLPIIIRCKILMMLSTFPVKYKKRIVRKIEKAKDNCVIEDIVLLFVAKVVSRV